MRWLLDFAKDKGPSCLKGRSRDVLTSKIHVVVDANGRPLQLGLTPARLTKIGSARIYWRDSSRNQCRWQIASITQTVSAYRHSLRQTRSQLPRFRQAGSHPHLAACL
jgi:hypothetical protein